MLKRSRVIAYSCVIAPVAFYAGIKLRATRPTSTETPLQATAALVPAPQEGVQWLREEERLLEDKRREIERKIEELQARTRNEKR